MSDLSGHVGVLAVGDVQKLTDLLQEQLHVHDVVVLGGRDLLVLAPGYQPTPASWCGLKVNGLVSI